MTAHLYTKYGCIACNTQSFGVKYTHGQSFRRLPLLLVANEILVGRSLPEDAYQGYMGACADIWCSPYPVRCACLSRLQH